MNIPEFGTQSSPALTLGAGVVKRPTRLADGRELIYFDDPDTTLGEERAVDARTLDPRPETATLRVDVLTGDWISVAAARQNRAFLPPPVKEVRRYTEGALPVPGKPEVVFTPGHTLGHCALHLADRDVVIAGDAVVMLDPYRGTTGPQIVSGAATADSPRNLASLDALEQTGAGTVATGHGPVWRQGAEEAVRLARAAGPS